MEETFGNPFIISQLGVGPTVVFWCIFTTVVIIVVFVAIDKFKSMKEDKNQQLAASQPQPKNNETSNDDDIVPVIAAAVAAAIGEKVVVRTISFARDIRNDTSWSHVTRAKQHLNSEKIQTSRRVYGK